MEHSKSIDATLLPANLLPSDEREMLAVLADRYHSLIFRVCLRFLGHQQDAEDVTQETFSRIIRHFDHWDQRLPIEPWIVTIAGNRCRSFLAARRQFRSLTPVIEPTADIENEARAAEQLSEELKLAMTTLPANHRIAFELFHHQQSSYEQIAESMGHPIGTVKTWVHRARLQIIDHLRCREVIGRQPAQPSKSSLSNREVNV
ncbi:RNA polymerase sigma factor [Rubripirellula amarantea]|nr:RNA polymerase sigma factor [Rubripirellula amarantea]